MPTGIEPYTIWDSGWTIRVRPPIDPKNCAVTVLLHGWTGDENSMSIFTNLLPTQDALFFPRAPIQAHPEGYGWLPHSQSVRPAVTQFKNIAAQLLGSIAVQTEEMGISTQRISLIGFSQGAALSLSIAGLFPSRIKRVALLAGFLPDGISTEILGHFMGKDFYIAHGKEDKTIPIEEALNIVEMLQTAGARVTFCQSNTGHKLSAGCLKGITEFFKQI